MICGARWLETAEVFCQKESGHPAEHESEIEIQYEPQMGLAHVSWISEANAKKREQA